MRLHQFIFLIIFIFLFQNGFALNLTNIPKNWKPASNTLPSIDAQYLVRSGHSEVSITYTSYNIPEVKRVSDFKNFIVNQYPEQSDGYPKIQIRNLSKCTAKFKNCFISLIQVTNKSNANYVILNYFSDDKKKYLGMSSITKNIDSDLIAEKIQKEILHAISP